MRRTVDAAHRVVWAVVRGEEFPDGKDASHRETCVRCCVNPDHIQPVEPPVNRYWDRMRSGGSRVTDKGAEE
jgi:hypothetical protein